MTKYHFIYLIWLLPLYFLAMNLYQLQTYNGIEQTWQTGESYVADVVDVEIKQIAAQTNGYVILTFRPQGEETIRRQLSLPVQMVQAVLESERIPVRYQPDSRQPIVILSTNELQRRIIRINLGVTLIGLVATAIIAWYASRYARRNIRYGEEKLVVERIDLEDAADETLDKA